MGKAKFIKLAMGLGLTVPACLLSLSSECSASIAKPQAIQKVLNPGFDKQNQVKNHMLNMIGPVQDTEFKQLAHTNIHANYTISHTNVHADYKVDSHHVDSHSNTPSKHVNDHSNSKV